MKKLFCLLAFIAPMLGSAKELPSQKEMMARLDESGITKSDQWETVGHGFKQVVKSGLLFVSADSVSSMMAVSNNEDEMMDSFAYAGIHCTTSSLIAIDMAQNKNLVNSMLKSFSESLKTYQNKNNTMVWGYSFETQLIKTGKGLIANCTLK